MLIDERKKKIATLLLIVVVIMLLFPPWIYTWKGKGSGRQSVKDNAGYSFVITPPSEDMHSGPEIDWGRLAIQIAIATCAASVIAISGLSISKKTLKIIGVTSGGVVTVLLSIYWYDYNKNILPRKQVIIGVSYDTEGCSAKYPMLVLITNNSSRVVEKVDFDISIKIPERSTDLVQHGLFPKYSTDQIIPPRKTWGECWSYPDDQARIFSAVGKDIKLENLIYDTKNKLVTLQ
ncbi:MAG: hypothetical protein ACYC6S_06150 [Desulfobulbia bacterium]